MKISEFENNLKQNLPSWEIEIYDQTARFIIKNKWLDENQINSFDIDYIKQMFNLNNLTIVNKIYKWEYSEIGINSIINIII